MQAILLATGESSGLSPLTDDLPPAMLPVGHQPVMAHVVETLAAQGFRYLLVSLFHRPARIEAYFGQGERWGVKLDYVIQREALGNAGALKRASRLLGETMLVISGERLADLDVFAAVNHHRQHGYAATVLVPATGVEGPVKYPNGGHEAAGARVAISPAELPSGLGIYILEPSALDFIPPATPFDVHCQLIPALLKNGLTVGAFPAVEYCNPMASFRDYLAAQRVFMNRLEAGTQAPQPRFFPHAASIRARTVQPDIWVGRNNAIHPSVRLAGPIFIGANCRIGRDVEIGPDVIVGANVIIDDEATLSQTIVLDNTYVGKLVRLDQRVAQKNLLIDVDSGSYVRVADAFWLSETHTSMDQSVARVAWDCLIAAAVCAAVLPFAAIWALALWVATGHVFADQAYQRPAQPASPGRPARPAHSLRVRNFYAAQSNRLAAWLSRWQTRLELGRLPELLSVLTGQMSLVGARPMTPTEAGQATEEWQLVQREMEPGFTGLWYLQSDTESELEAALVADVYYAATRSWQGDMKILWQTPGAWLRRLRVATLVTRSRP